MISVGYTAKANAQHAQILIGSNMGRARESQNNLISSTTNILKRTQITFDNIQREIYIKSGGIMTLGMTSVGSLFDQTA